MRDVVLPADGIGKSFGATVALRQASIEVAAGGRSVHGLTRSVLRLSIS